MNRTGLIIALLAAGAGGLLFALFPELDLRLAGFFYDKAARQFAYNPLGVAQYFRRAAMWIAWAFVVPAMIAPLVKLIWPHRPLLVRGRSIVFLLTTILITAIFLPNVVFKPHWSRPRPTATREFNGEHLFKPWWDPRGAKPEHRSFFSGEAATAFWTYAPAALAPGPVRPWAYAAATIFGLTTGALRMAFGGHYASDILAAGVASFLVVWIVHGVLYRWKGRGITDERIEGALGEIGLKLRQAGSFWVLVAIIAALTVARLVALRFSVVDLFPDEARYWAWAQAPSFGYFSKPPLIAWVIAATERVCGSAEFCLRAPAPLFYAGTALLSYFIARHVSGDRAAYWTGLSVILATGVVYSVRIISTDVPLLFFWALALLAWLKLRERPSWPWTMALGAALGFGLLSKYAMAYFFLGMIAAAWIDPTSRALWRGKKLWIGFAIAGAIIAPNVLWNAAHDFVTLRHTFAHIIDGPPKTNPFGPVVFLATQFGVVGPVLFAVFALAVLRPARFALGPADRLMIMFAAPPLLLVAAVATLTSAEANWAAPAAISIIPLAVSLLLKKKQTRLLYLSVAIGLILQVILPITDARAERITVPWLANPDVYHRTLGWKALAGLVRQSAASHGARSIMTEQSSLVPELLYYLRNDSYSILSYSSRGAPASQFDLDRPWNIRAPDPVLYLCLSPLPDQLAQSYTAAEPLPPIVAPTGAHSSRGVFAFKLQGPRAVPSPAR